MKKIKVAMLFPYAPAYRGPIYMLMDKNLDVDWYFAGNAKRNLKMFDYSLFKHCNLDMEEQKVLGPITRYKGIERLPLDQYDVIIFAGVIRCLSEWWLMWKFGRKKIGPKLYLWTHGWYGKESVVVKVLKKLFLYRVHGFLLYGNYAKNLMIKEGFDSSKLHVIYNSLDYDKQLDIRTRISLSDVYVSHFRNNKPVVIFIGRLTAVKSLGLLINALSLLKNRGEEYNLVFVGDGEMRDNLEREAIECGLRDNVWFYGACYDEKTNAELLYNADVCVAPGNIGLTAMHSLMFGCPIISHNDFKWQMPEFESIQPGINGDFFDFNNVESLSRCISNWLLTKKSKREEIRRACYKVMDECFNPHYQLGVLERILTR